MGSHSEPMSEGADLTPPGVARMISEFLEQLDLDGATIVGNDSGGAVSQILVTEHPRADRAAGPDELRLLREVPAGALQGPIQGGAAARRRAILARSLQIGFVRHGPLAYGALTAGRMDDGAALVRRPVRTAIPGVRRDGIRFAAGAAPKLTMAAAAKLPGLRIPVLLAWGADDRFFTLADARRLADAIPDSRLVEIEGGRTFVSLDRPGGSRPRSRVRGGASRGIPAAR